MPSWQARSRRRRGAAARSRPAARWLAARRAVLCRAELVEPDAPHCRSQRHRPCRALDRHHFSLAVPRRPDRRAHPEPAGAGRDHRRRHRLVGDRRNRFLDHARSRQAAQSASGRKLRSERRRALRHRLPDQSGTRRADPAAAGVADQDARAHLRPRRRAARRQPQSVRPRRRAALRSAAADRGKAGLLQARLHRACGCGSGAATCRVYRELGPDDGRGYSEVAQALNGAGRQHGARQRSRRRHRLGRGAGAALPRRARRADALDARRRYRRHGGGRAARHHQGLSGRRRRHDRAVDPARRHHRRAGAPARRRRRKRAPAHPLARRDSRFHPPPRRDRPSCPARCAT